MTTGDGDELWKTKRLAKKLSVTERHLQRLAENDLIPHVWLGPRVLRFDPEKVRAWVEAGGLKQQKPKRKR